MSQILLWTPDRVDLLRHLAAREDKPTATALGKLFDCSKNAIIAACRRYGVKLPRSSSAGIPRMAKGPRKRRTKLTNPWKPRMKKPLPVPVECVVPLHIDLFELKRHQCRYPYGEGPFVFCGHPAHEGSSYCPSHHRLCYRDETVEIGKAA